MLPLNQGYCVSRQQDSDTTREHRLTAAVSKVTSHAQPTLSTTQHSQQLMMTSHPTTATHLPTPRTTRHHPRLPLSDRTEGQCSTSLLEDSNPHPDTTCEPEARTPARNTVMEEEDSVTSHLQTTLRTGEEDGGVGIAGSSRNWTGRPSGKTTRGENLNEDGARGQRVVEEDEGENRLIAKEFRDPAKMMYMEEEEDDFITSEGVKLPACKRDTGGNASFNYKKNLHFGDNVLKHTQVEELIFSIDSHTKELQKRNLDLRPLIKTNRRESNDTLRDIHDIIFSNGIKKFPTLTLKVSLKNDTTNQGTCEAILDTGSNYEILNSNLVKDINMDTSDLPCILSANGGRINVIGKATLPLQVGKNTFPTRFLIVEGLAAQIILGNTFMLTHGIEILYTKKQIVIHNEGKKEIIPMSKSWVLSLVPHVFTTNEIKHSDLIEVRSSEDLAIKGRQHYKMLELDEKYANSDFEIEKNFRDRKKMHAYLATDECGKPSIVLYNPSKISKWVKKSALVGYLRPNENTNNPQTVTTTNTKSKYQVGKIIVCDKNGDELNINPNLSVKEHNEVANMLKKYAHMFTNSVKDLTVSDVPPVRIKLKPNAKPVNLPPYRQSFKERQLLDSELDKLLEAGVMQEAEDYCSWASPIFHHRNSDGSSRIITDFRALNEQIEKDTWPLPSIDQVLSCLSGNKFFSRLDLKNSFHQVRVDERDRKYLTVTTQTRRIAYKVLPQGLSVSTVAFQRAIVKILSKHLYVRAIPYVDDIPIIGSTFSDNLENIEIILQELDKFKLKLNTKKSLFMYKQIEILGHEISEEGCRPLQSSVEAIQALKLPKTIKAVRSLLGSFNFFRAFLPNFAKVALPITNLIKEYNKTNNINWTDECTKSVEELKRILMSKPLLSHFREDRETLILCDASAYAIGAALMQTDPITGVTHPVCYLSRKLRPNEINHSVCEKEMSALTYACVFWRPYLLGRKVICYTDHQSLVFLKSFKGHSSRLSRLAMILSDFDIEVRYKPGKQMDLPDMLSRHPVEKYMENEALATIHNVNSLVQVDLAEEQRTDPNLRHIINVLSKPDPKSKEYMKLSNSYMLRDSILYKKIYIDKMHKYVIVVPKNLQKQILQEFHDSPISGGHLNAVKTLLKIKDRFFWENMSTHVHQYVKTCISCQKRKIPPRKAYGPLQPIPIASSPFSRIQLDIMGPLCPSNKFKYILTVTDSHSRMAFAFNLINADAKSISNCLLKLFFVYGIPNIIQSDLGTENKNALFTCLNTALGSCQIFSSAYAPRVNGQVEKFHSVLANLLSHYVHEKPNTWSNYVDKVVFCYNNSVHHVLKEKPSYLFLGYNVQLPSDTLITLPHSDKDLINRLQVLEEVRKSLPELIKKEQDRQAKYHDRDKANIELNPGDEVLISYPYNLREPMSKFSQVYKGPFTVLNKLSPNSYNVEILKNNRLVTESIHVSRIKLYHRRE